MSVTVGVWNGGERISPLSANLFGATSSLLREARHIFRPGTRRLRLTIIGLLAALSMLMMAIVSYGHESTIQRNNARTWYLHTLNVLLVSGEFKTSVHAALRGERGYLLTADRRFLLPYRESVATAPALVARLRALTQDNPAQQRALATLAVQVRDYFQLLDFTVALTHYGRGDEALRIVRLGHSKHRIDAILETVSRIEAEEKRLLRARAITFERAARRDERYESALAALGILLLVIAALAGALAVRAHSRALAATAQLRRMATTDELTELPNRRQFLASLEAETARAERSGMGLCLAVIDVDHFKRINDNHGHPAGDHVLRNLADVLREGTRAGDVLGRIGGEEFALLMPHTGVAEASIVCDRLRERLATRLMILPSGSSSQATMSTGIASLAPQERASSLISRADAALYKAKLAGRNCVQLAA